MNSILLWIKNDFARKKNNKKNNIKIILIN